MDIIINTGFEKVTHNIEFQPATEPKGKKLVDAKHVYGVNEYRKDGISFLIEAQIIRQASVASVPYNTRLNIDPSRKITSVACTCIYNNSGKCKHVAALIHYVNNEESLSKTSEEQQWGKPSVRQLIKEKYSKGKNFFEMFPGKVRSQVAEPSRIDISNMKDAGLKAVLLIEYKSESDKAIEDVMRAMVSQVDLMLQKEDCESCVKTFMILNDSKKTYKSPYLTMTTELKEFYTSFIIKSKEEIIQVSCDTLAQSKCTEWFQARSLRISASTNVHSIKRRIKKSVESLVQEILYPKNVDTASTRYGNSHGSTAIAQYCETYGVSVKKVGLIISQKQPWLCTSLDGVVIENGLVSKIVEIKCPSSCIKQPIADFATLKCNVSYLQFKTDKIHLKESAAYYTQCQIQLYISGLDICDLFVYSPVKNGSVCVQVHRDEKFLSDVIVKCEKFYFEHYLLPLQARVVAKKAKVNEASVMKQKQTQFTGKNIFNKLY